MPVSIGVIGSGQVGQTLAAGYAGKGHAVTIGSRDPAKLAAWGKDHPDVTVGDFADAAAADVVLLAVGGSVAIDAVAAAGVERLAGKVVIDACNPIAGPPVNGVLPYFTGPGDSLIQRLQAAVPAARFVKAFSSVGNALMIDPGLAGGPPSMFICGDDAAAKAVVAELLAEVGWAAEDVGPAAMGGPVEALCQLWCAPGFLRGDWSHAFRVLR
jgi:predicted dinucleotide-binding enzyme